METNTLIERLQKADKNIRGSHIFYGKAKETLKKAVKKIVEEHHSVHGLDSIIGSYRTIEEASDDRNRSIILDSEVREVLEDAIITLVKEKKNKVSEKQLHEIFDITIVNRYGHVDSAKKLADDLGIQLTKSKLKVIQEGLVKNALRADQFYALQEQFGIPVTKEIAERYVDRALRKKITHVVAYVALQLIDDLDIDYSAEQKMEYLQEMVKNENYDDAVKVAEHWEMPSEWISDKKQKQKKPEQPEDFESIMKGHIGNFYKETKTKNKAEQVGAIIDFLGQKPSLESMLSDKDLAAIADFAQKEWLSKFFYLVEHTRLSPDEGTVERTLLRYAKDNADAALRYYVDSGREFSKKFRSQFFNELKERVVDAVKAAKILGIPVTKELHIFNFSDTAGRFIAKHKKYGLPEELTEEDKKKIYANIVRISTSPHGFYDFEELPEVACILGVPFDKESIVPHLREKLKYCTLDTALELYDTFGLFGEELLQKWLEQRHAEYATRLAMKMGKNSKEIVDYFISHRDDREWNTDGAFHRTCVDEAIVDTSIALGEFGYFFEKIIDEKDMDWIAKATMIMGIKEEAQKQVKDPRIIVSKLYDLQHELALQCNYIEAERLVKLFPKIPISPVLAKYLASQN